MAILQGVKGFVIIQDAPLQVKLRIEGAWDGKTLTPELCVVEHALRDAAFFLYGQRTGPGYTITLQPVRRIEEDGVQFIETRVTIIPKGEPDRGRLARQVIKAAHRAYAAMVRGGVELPAIVKEACGTAS